MLYNNEFFTMTDSITYVDTDSLMFTLKRIGTCLLIFWFGSYKIAEPLGKRSCHEVGENLLLPPRQR